MESRSKIKWKTNIKVIVFDLEGNILDIQEFHNLITNVGLNMARDMLYGDVSDGEIKYMAIGDDNTAPTVGDTTLGNETFRKARTSQSKPGIRQTRYIQYISPPEAVGNIEEFGWFASRDLILAEDSDPLTTETSDRLIREGTDSGLMVSRVLYSRVKTALESLQIERTDTFVEG